MRRDSRLLINESPLQVLPSLAVAIGLNEALVLQQIHYWLLLSQHDYDDRRWVYNTFAAWQRQFPFWSVRTLKTVFANLEKSGLVLVGHYNTHQWDRTKWYSIDYDALDALDTPIVQKLPLGGGKANTMTDAEVAQSSSTEITTQEDRYPRHTLAHLRSAVAPRGPGRR